MPYMFYMFHGDDNFFYVVGLSCL